MEYLYETPWWLPTGFILVGVVLLVSGRSRPSKRMVGAGMALLVFAGVLITASYVLKSDREQVVDNTEALVQKTVARDWAGVERLLHPDVAVADLWRGRSLALAGGRAAVERWGLRSANIAGPLGVLEVSDSYVVRMRVAAQAGDIPTVTDWELRWEEDASRVAVARCTGDAHARFVGRRCQAVSARERPVAPAAGERTDQTRRVACAVEAGWPPLRPIELRPAVDATNRVSPQRTNEPNV